MRVFERVGGLEFVGRVDFACGDCGSLSPRGGVFF